MNEAFLLLAAFIIICCSNVGDCRNDNLKMYPCKCLVINKTLFLALPLIAAIYELYAIIQDLMYTNSNTELFEFIDKLFLNIYSYLPQETVANFLVKYSNLLYWRYSPHKGEWTIYPPNHEEFKFELIKHSIEFNSHPCFPESFYKGYLEILNTETGDGNSTQELKLNLLFREKSMALKAIELIDKSMTGLDCKKKEQTISRCLMVEYSSDSQDILSGISYKFSKDVIENYFRLLIYPATNRIHFIK